KNLQYTSMGSYGVVVSNAFGRMISLPAHLIVKPPPVTTGSLDTRFNTGSGPDGIVLAIVLREDKIFIGGRFTSFDEIKGSRVARLFLDGSLDPSFTPDIDLNNSVACMAVEADGKVLIGGYFTKLG